MDLPALQSKELYDVVDLPQMLARRGSTPQGHRVGVPSRDRYVGPTYGFVCPQEAQARRQEAREADCGLPRMVPRLVVRMGGPFRLREQLARQAAVDR